MPRPLQIMKSTAEAGRPCQDCEEVLAEVWCDSCSAALCRECDLQCHQPDGFAGSHRRDVLVSLVRKDFGAQESWTALPDCDKHEALVKGNSGGLFGSDCAVRDGKEQVPPDGSSRQNRRKKKRNSRRSSQSSTPAQGGGDPEQNESLCQMRPLSDSNLSRSVSFPSNGGKCAIDEDTSGQSAGTEHEGSSTCDEHFLSSSPEGTTLMRSSTFPSTFRPRSALRGGHEVTGLGPRPKLHVQWAPGVQEPMSSTVSHTVGHKPQSSWAKDQKNRHKGKNSQGYVSGKSEKRKKRKNKKDGDSRQLRVEPGSPRIPSAAAPGSEKDVLNLEPETGRSRTSEGSSEDHSDPGCGTGWKRSMKQVSTRSEKASVLTENDVVHIVGGNNLHMKVDSAEECGVSSEQKSAQGKPAVSSSLLMFREQSVAEAMKSLQSLSARRVAPEGCTTTHSEANGSSDYYQNAVACMVHAAQMVAENNTSGATVEFEASARFFRLAEKTVRMENTAGSEVVAKHSLRGQVMAWVAMATLYAKSGQTYRAEKCHLALLQACQGSGMKLEAGMCLLDEGQCQLKREEFKRAHAFFEAAASLLEAELQSEAGQQDLKQRSESYYAQLREILVKAGRLAGVAALKSGDTDVAKRHLLGALVAARRLHMKAEEARCLRLLAELQEGTQHLSSLQAAADAMSVSNIPYEHAEALFCLGSCKVSLHLSTLHSTSQVPRDNGLIESAKSDLEEAVSVLQAPLDGVFKDAAGNPGQAHPALENGGENAKTREHSLALCDRQQLDSAIAILLGRLYEALGRTCVLMGEFLEARTYFGLALRDKEWATTYQDAARQVETLLDTLQWEGDGRTCRSSWGAMVTSVATGV